MTLGSYDLSPRLVDDVELFAPVKYWDLDEACKAARGYDCGPGKFGAHFVPDTMWGLNVKAACQIHDHMYATGQTQFDKWVADVTFLTNLNDIIEAKSWPVVKEFRRYRAMSYFSAVRDGGNSSFWKGKEKPNHGI
jgi:hypothetical protein